MKKKNIKYIGSAVAAALLAAGSPIIINHVVPTIVVKAAGEILPPDKAPAPAKDMLTNFRNQFDDRYISSTDSLVAALQNMINTDKGTSFFYFNPQNPQYLYDIQNNKGISGLKDRDKVTELGTSPGYFGTSDSWDLTDYYYRDIKGYLSITVDGKNSPETLTHLGTNSNDSNDPNDPDSLAQLAYEIKNKNIKLPITVGVHLVQSKDSKDGYGTTYPQGSLYGVKSDLTDFSFKVYSSKFDITKDTNQVSVSHGTSISDQNSPLQSGNDSLSVTDNFSNLTSDSEDMGRKAIYGKHLFNSASAALGYAQSNTFDPSDSTSKVEGTVDKDGKAVTGGPYYQTVSFKLDNGKDKAIEYMLSGADDDLTGTVIQPYETYINGSDTQAKDGKDYAFNRLTNPTTKQNIGMLTIVRPVVVEGTIGSDLTNPKVAIGSSASLTDNSILSDTSGDELKDESGNEIANNGIEIDPTYYSDNAAQNVAKDAVVDGKFAKTGTYYRKVIFTLASGSTKGLTSTDGKIDSVNNTVTFLQPVTVQNGVSANIASPGSTVGNPVSGTTSDVSGDTLGNGTDETLIDPSQGSNKGISFGTDYYADDGNSTYSDILDGKAKAEPGVVDANNNFAKAGDYLRTITFYLVKGTIDTNNFEASGQTYSLNTDNNTVTYIQKVHIAPSANVTKSIETVTVNITGQDAESVKNLAATTNDTLGLKNSAGDVTSLIDTTKNDDGFTNGVKFGTTYYTENSIDSSVGDLNTADTTRYREITFYLNKDITNIDFSNSGVVASTSNTVTFLQSISVKEGVKADATATLKESNVSADKIAPTVMEGNNNLIKSITYETSWYDTPEEALNSDGTSIGSSSHIYEPAGSKKLFGLNGQAVYRKVTITLNDGTSLRDNIQFDANDMKYTINGDTITYAQKVNFISSTAEVTIPDKDVSIGSVLSDSEIKNTDDAGMSIDITGIFSIATSKPYSFDDGAAVAYSGKFYDSVDAFNNGEVDDGVVNNGNFAKSGSFYREITISLYDGWASGFDYNDPDSNFVSVDTTGNTVTYLQKVNVIAPTVTSSITAANASVGETADNVSDNGTTDITTKTTLDDGTTQTSSIIDSTKTSYGNQYFTSATNALSNTDGTEGPFTTASATDPYYRRVTLTLITGKLRDYNINGTSGTDYIDNDDGTVTFAQPVMVGTAEVTPTLKGDVTVTSGEDISSEQGEETNTITGVNGTSLVDKVTFGDYYPADNDDKATALADILNGKTSATTDPVNGTVYGKAGAYYRTVILHLKKDALNSYTIKDATDAQINKNDNTVTYLQEVTVTVPKVTSKITGATAKVGETAGDLKGENNGTTDITLDDGTGSIIDATKTNYGNQYFTSATNALNNINGTTDSFTAVTTPDKPYYRLVTLTLANGKPLRDYAINGTSGTDYIDNGDGTVTFAQPVTVGTAEATPKLNGDVTVYSGSDVASEQGKETNTITGINDTKLVDKVTFGDYYSADNTDEAAALVDILSGKTSATTDPVNGTVYGKVGTYYRTVILHLTEGALNSYTINGATDTQINTNDNTVTYLQKVTIAPIVTVPTVTSNMTGAKAKVGETVNHLTDDGAANITLDDGTGSSIIDSTKTSYGDQYFTSATNALNNIDGTTGAFTKVTTPGKPYYRLITLTLANGKTLSDYKINGTSGTDYIDNGDGTVTFAQEVTVTAPTVTIPSVTSNITGAKAKVGETVNHLTDDGTANITLSDGTSSIIDPAKTSYGDQYYTSAANALNNINGITGAFTTVTTPGKPYYRLVTLTLANGKTLSDYKINGTSGTDYIDNGDGTVTFAQEVTVTAPTVTVPSVMSNITGAKAKVGDSVNKLTDNGTADITLSDGTGSIIDPAKTSYGDQYFTSASDTLNNINGTKDPFTTVTTPDKPYYRLVTVTLANGKSLSDYALNGTSGTDYIDNGDGTVTFAQEVTVNKADPIAATVNTDTVTSTVGSSVSTLPGVNDKYTVNKTDDKTLITSVASAGAVYRSYDAGQLSDPVTSFDIAGKYYRVITFNAADADKYSFADSNVISNENGIITYAQPIIVSEATVNPIAATVNTDTVTSTVGSSVSTLPAVNGNYTVNKADDNQTITSTPIAGAVYKGYDAKTKELSNSVTSFDTEGTYYRIITFEVANADKYSFADGNVISNENGKITYAQPITVNKATVDPIAAKVNIDTVTSTVGNLISTLPVTNDKYILKTVDGKTIKSEASAETTVYKNYDVETKKLSDPVTGFDAVGKYYRVITFKVINDNDQYTFTDPNVISNKDGVVTYIQAITVTAPEVTAATVNIDKVTSTVGSLISTLPATNKNYTLTTADGKTITSTASAGTSVYKNYDATTKKLSDSVTSFDTVGTYYRVITFKVADADKYSFADGNIISNENGVITYVQPISVGQESGAKVSQAVTDTKNVKVDVNGDDSSLSSKVGYSLTDADGNSLIDAPTAVAGISFSPEYYIMKDNTLTPATSSDAHDYTISKKGTYYRRVIFKVSANTIANYDFSAIKGEVNKTDSTVSFLQKIDASTNPATATITSPSVNYDTSSDAASLKDPTGVTLKDDKGDTINSGNPTFSGIFSTKENAQNATSDNGNVTGDLKEGSYYQRVTFPLAENDNNAYDFGDGIVSQDGKSVTYIREITVKPSTGGGSNTGGNTGNNTGNNNAGTGDEDDWTYYYDNYGVVTTKTGQDSYQLNNRANEAIENRELAKDTSWKTDQYRTNRAGVKQYRVATNEWIDSNDVYFAEKSTGDEDDWTYYYDSYGVVKTKADQNSYQLNNRANEMIKNRELGKNTSWKTDQYRTNRAGVKQYRVATNEWIDSRDVYLIDNEDDWTYYKDAGVVRTVIGQDYYSLKNWTNETVKNRALIKQSSWKTDQYRTNRAGVKQYHVATNEWIDSHDVTFIKDIKGIVNVDETSSYYTVYNIDREVVTNRALKKDTSWLTDRQAIDPAGNVYYRVATNEWIKQVKGVYLDTNAWYK
ncbi:beta strand repeat-containing protein [Companilactobacillus sp. HBUAS56275]